MSMTHDICFGNLHEDTVDEVTLYLPNKVFAHPQRLFVRFSSFLKRKSQRWAATSTRSGSRHRLARRAQRSEENLQEKTEKPRKQPDLRTLKMGEVRHIARDLGCPKAEIDVWHRWSLVGYIERHGKNEYEDLIRLKKRNNEQELNQDFQNQVNQLFREQCERLIQTTLEQFISSIKVDLNISFPLGDLEKQALNSPTLLPLDSQPSAMDFGAAKSG